MPKRKSISIPKEERIAEFVNTPKAPNSEQAQFPQLAKKGLLPQKTVRMEENLSKAIKVVAKDLGVSEQDYLHQIIKNDVSYRLAEAQKRAISEIQNIQLEIQ